MFLCVGNPHPHPYPVTLASGLFVYTYLFIALFKCACGECVNGYRQTMYFIYLGEQSGKQCTPMFIFTWGSPHETKRSSIFYFSSRISKFGHVSVSKCWILSLGAAVRTFVDAWGSSRHTPGLQQGPSYSAALSGKNTSGISPQGKWLP